MTYVNQLSLKLLNFFTHTSIISAVKFCVMFIGFVFILGVLHFQRNFSNKVGLHPDTDVAVYHFPVELEEHFISQKNPKSQLSS